MMPRFFNEIKNNIKSPIATTIALPRASKEYFEFIFFLKDITSKLDSTDSILKLLKKLLKPIKFSVWEDSLFFEDKSGYKVNAYIPRDSNHYLIKIISKLLQVYSVKDLFKFICQAFDLNQLRNIKISDLRKAVNDWVDKASDYLFIDDDGIKYSSVFENKQYWVNPFDIELKRLNESFDFDSEEDEKSIDLEIANNNSKFYLNMYTLGAMLKTQLVYKARLVSKGNAKGYDGYKLILEEGEKLGFDLKFFDAFYYNKLTINYILVIHEGHSTITSLGEKQYRMEPHKFNIFSIDEYSKEIWMQSIERMFPFIDEYITYLIDEYKHNDRIKMAIDNMVNYYMTHLFRGNGKKKMIDKFLRFNEGFDFDDDSSIDLEIEKAKDKINEQYFVFEIYGELIKNWINLEYNLFFKNLKFTLKSVTKDKLRYMVLQNLVSTGVELMFEELDNKKIQVIYTDYDIGYKEIPLNREFTIKELSTKKGIFEVIDLVVQALKDKAKSDTEVIESLKEINQRLKKDLLERKPNKPYQWKYTNINESFDFEDNDSEDSEVNKVKTQLDDFFYFEYIPRKIKEEYTKKIIESDYGIGYYLNLIGDSCTIPFPKSRFRIYIVKDPENKEKYVVSCEDIGLKILGVESFYFLGEYTRQEIENNELMLSLIDKAWKHYSELDMDERVMQYIMNVADTYKGKFNEIDLYESFDFDNDDFEEKEISRTKEQLNSFIIFDKWKELILNYIKIGRKDYFINCIEVFKKESKNSRFVQFEEVGFFLELYKLYNKRNIPKNQNLVEVQPNFIDIKSYKTTPVEPIEFKDLDELLKDENIDRLVDYFIEQMKIKFYRDEEMKKKIKDIVYKKYKHMVDNEKYLPFGRKYSWNLLKESFDFDEDDFEEKEMSKSKKQLESFIIFDKWKEIILNYIKNDSKNYYEYHINYFKKSSLDSQFFPIGPTGFELDLFKYDDYQNIKVEVKFSNFNREPSILIGTLEFPNLDVLLEEKTIDDIVDYFIEQMKIKFHNNEKVKNKIQVIIKKCYNSMRRLEKKAPNERNYHWNLLKESFDFDNDSSIDIEIQNTKKEIYDKYFLIDKWAEYSKNYIKYRFKRRAWVNNQDKKLRRFTISTNFLLSFTFENLNLGEYLIKMNIELYHSFERYFKEFSKVCKEKDLNNLKFYEDIIDELCSYIKENYNNTEGYEKFLNSIKRDYNRFFNILNTWAKQSKIKLDWNYSSINESFDFDGDDSEEKEVQKTKDKLEDYLMLDRWGEYLKNYIKMNYETKIGVFDKEKFLKTVNHLDFKIPTSFLASINIRQIDDNKFDLKIYIPKQTTTKFYFEYNQIVTKEDLFELSFWNMLIDTFVDLVKEKQDDPSFKDVMRYIKTRYNKAVSFLSNLALDKDIDLKWYLYKPVNESFDFEEDDNIEDEVSKSNKDLEKRRFENEVPFIFREFLLTVLKHAKSPYNFYKYLASITNNFIEVFKSYNSIVFFTGLNRDHSEYEELDFIAYKRADDSPIGVKITKTSIDNLINEIQHNEKVIETLKLKLIDWVQEMKKYEINNSKLLKYIKSNYPEML